MKWNQQVDSFTQRFKKELGYKIVMPWPIFERQNSKKIIYYMIHATDHQEAHKLMSRAYANAVKPLETHEQLGLMFGDKDEANS